VGVKLGLLQISSTSPKVGFQNAVEDAVIAQLKFASLSPLECRSSLVKSTRANLAVFELAQRHPKWAFRNAFEEAVRLGSTQFCKLGSAGSVHGYARVHISIYIDRVVRPRYFPCVIYYFVCVPMCSYVFLYVPICSIC